MPIARLKRYIAPYHGTTQWQMALFLMVGGFNTLFGYALYSLFVFIGVPLASTVFLTMLCGLFFNFKTTGKIVFKNSNNHLFFKFLAMHVGLYFFYVAIIKILNSSLNDLYLSGFIAIFPNAAVSFLLNKYLVFRTPREIN